MTHKGEIIAKNTQLIDSISNRSYGREEGLLVVYYKGKAGLAKWRELMKPVIQKMIAPVYDSIVDVYYDYEQKPSAFLVKKGKKITVVNEEGVELMPFIYEEYGKWDDWYIVTKKDNKAGVYSFREKYEIKPQYDFIEYFGSNPPLWKVRINGRSGFINKNG